MHKGGEEEEFKKTVTCLPDYEPELLEQIWKSSTGLFREFIIEFIERIFTLIENLPDPSSSKHRASQESNVIMLLSPTFSAVMSALPKDLHEVVVTRFLDFISNNVYYSATDAIALICSTIVRDDPSGVFLEFSRFSRPASKQKSWRMVQAQFEVARRFFQETEHLFGTFLS